MGRASTSRMVIGLGILLPVALAAAGCGGTAGEGQAGGGTDSAMAGQQPDNVLVASIRAGLPPGGVTRADLPEPDSLGAELVAQFCGACHGISLPSTHSATDWPVVLRRMWLRTDRVAALGVDAPDAAQRIVILRYMLRNALQVSEANLPAGRGREQFMETCSRCHALPDPKSHAADDWAGVVLRMKTRIETMLGETLLQDRIADLVFYLQSASGS